MDIPHAQRMDIPKPKSAAWCTCCTPSFFRQWYALMWKNWHMKKRLYCSTLFEIGLPVLIILIVVSIRGAVAREDKEISHYFDDFSKIVRFDPDLGAMDLATKPDPLDVVSVRSMEQMAVKLIRRGHIIAISPNRPPYFDNFDPSSFSSYLNRIIDKARSTYNLPDTRQNYVRGFSNLNSIDDYVKDKGYPNDGLLEAGIGFGDTVSASRGASYTIRMNQTESLTKGFQGQIPNTRFTPDRDDLTVNLNTRISDTLDDSGWFALQEFIEGWIVEHLGGTFQSSAFNFIPFPIPSHTEDRFSEYSIEAVPLIFAFGYVWPVTRIVKSIVEEKELRIKEGLKIVGLHASSHFMSWFTTYFLISLAYSILIVLASTSVFKFSSPFVVFLFFWIYGNVLFAFSWAVGSIFNKASIGSTMGALLYLGAFFGFFGIATDADAGTKQAACLSAPICFSFGLQNFIQFESVSTGVTMNNIGTEYQNISVSTIFAFLILDLVLYIVVALYMERVVPTEFGTQLPPWFFLLPSWWFGKGSQIFPKGVPLKANGERDFGEYYEPISDGKIGVSILGLKKRFPTQAEDEAAVRGLDVDMCVSQITALLGHNGAGKTTVINMMTGMLQPTGGDALIFDRSILTEMRNIRADMGMCPQHNILWDYLTVREHLLVYGRIKNVTPFSRLDEVAKTLIKEVGLTEKANVISKNLSGGMKRKLSVAISLIGESRVVFLDEPTSGMDPYSRRNVWEMLKRSKQGRVLILTTHFMDEADYLGDRIAIMDKGKLVVCGTPLYLKNQFGVGYNLAITVTGDPTDACECVERHIPTATMLSIVAGEVAYQLPKKDSNKFADLFEDLDKHLVEYNVDAYVISMTTMEEVFLRVGKGEAVNMETSRETLRKQKSRVMLKEIKIQEIKHDIKDNFEKKEKENKIEETKHDQGTLEKGKEEKKSEENQLDQGTLEKVKKKKSVEIQLYQGTVEKGEEKKIEETKHDQGTLDKGKENKIEDDHGTLEKKSDEKLKDSVVKSFHLGHHDKNLIKIDTKPVPFYTHVAIMLQKRWDQSKRDTSVFLWQIVYPSIIIIAGIGLLKLALGGFRQDISLNVSQYNSPNRVPLGSGAYPILATIGDQSNPLLLNATTPDGNSLTQEGGCSFTSGATAVSDEDISRYLLCTWETYKETRYGSYGTNGNTTITSIFFNTTGSWAAPIFMNLYNQAQMRSTPGVSRNAKIDVTLSAFPRTDQQDSLSTIYVALIAAIGFAFMPANVARSVVHEREIKSKHLQIISGVPLAAYWTANFIWDVALILPAGLLSIAWFQAYDIENLGGEAGGALVLGMILYSMSIVAFTYVVTFGFKSEVVAQNTCLLIYILIGGILLVASQVLDIISSTRDLNEQLKFIYRLFPSFCLGEVILNLLTRDSVFLFGEPLEVWDLKIVGYPMIYMACLFFGFLGMLFTIELIISSPSLYAWFFSSSKTIDVKEDEDYEGSGYISKGKQDVDNEVKRVQESTLSHMDAITVLGLRKVYGDKAAVKDMWFSVPKGQCFGFLGTNGAGKTTTLKMLTGDEVPSKGTARLNGLDVLENQREVRKKMGYCPQFDALLPNMTARETLRMFARIKGVLSEELERYVDRLIKRLNLTPYADKPCKGYSGGNMRKLSFGIALIGGPPVVFLDEPSTGMDPVSRRFMWDLISGTLADASVILTTHSLEECEALCQRIGIMVSGKLRCIGSIPHLKKEFASGYQVRVKISPEKTESFRAWIKTLFSDAEIRENQNTNMTYQIAHKKESSVGKIFRIFEENKTKQGILEYSVSQTSLEQIFIQFAMRQAEEKAVLAAFAKEKKEGKSGGFQQIDNKSVTSIPAQNATLGGGRRESIGAQNATLGGERRESIGGRDSTYDIQMDEKKNIITV
ncbi:hypothetical protein AAMO2058_001321300 [Amorphochlora amoebiformis]